MVRIYSILILLLFSNISFSQNYKNDADNELQEVLKNYNQFNIESLLGKQYKFIKEFKNYLHEENKSKLIERDIDFGWKESIYFFGFLYFNNNIGHSKAYLVHVFKENNSIVGLISYDRRRKFKKYYFDNDKLEIYVRKHNDFYKTNSKIENFVDDFGSDENFGNCGEPTTYIPPRYKDLEYNLSNIKFFEKMLKSYSPELQRDAVLIYEYLINEKLIPKREHRKLIKHIKERNSMIISCAGPMQVF